MGIIVVHLGDPRIWPSLLRPFTGPIVELLSLIPANGAYFQLNTDPSGNPSSLGFIKGDKYEKEETEKIHKMDSRSLHQEYLPWNTIYDVSCCNFLPFIRLQNNFGKKCLNKISEKAIG